MPLVQRAEMAFRDAVREVVNEHADHGWPLYIWRGGKVIEISGEELKRMASITNRFRLNQVSSPLSFGVA